MRIQHENNRQDPYLCGTYILVEREKQISKRYSRSGGGKGYGENQSSVGHIGNGKDGSGVTTSNRMSRKASPGVLVET